MDLGKGANAPLALVPVTVEVTGGLDVDLCALLLAANGRVRDDTDFVFFNQPTSPCGSVELVGARTIHVTLPQVPADVATIAIAASLDAAAPGGFGERLPVMVTVRGRAVDLRHSVVDVATERCVLLVELYRRDGSWKLRAVSQGWDDGLAGLATTFGVDVEPTDAPSTPPPPPAGQPGATQPAPARPSPLPAAQVAELLQRVQAGVVARRPVPPAPGLPGPYRPPVSRTTPLTAHRAAQRATAATQTAFLEAARHGLDQVLRAAPTSVAGLSDDALLTLADASVQPGLLGWRKLLARPSGNGRGSQPSTYLRPVLAELRQRASTLGEPEAVEAWLRLASTAADLPPALGHLTLVELVSGTLVVDIELADRGVIPAAQRVRYDVALDRLVPVPVKVAELTRLTEHLFAASALAHAATTAVAATAAGLPRDTPIVVNAWERAADPATGRVEQACRATLRSTPGSITGMQLTAVEPVLCVRQLGGQVAAGRPVTPIAQRAAGTRATQRSGRRLVDLTTIDPIEFEALVEELVLAMGYRAQRTARSADGGVDVFVQSNDPLTTGTIVISVKRYRGTVDPKYVRDLLGTMRHEHAVRGVLITTSQFGPTAHEFARTEPLQLVDGVQLREWLRTYLDVEAT